jgi:hypothetical protein
MRPESCVERKIPDVLDDLGAANALAGVAHQVFEERELLGSELDGAACALDGVFDAVEFEVLDSKDHIGSAAATAQKSADACRQFGKGERFDDEIVGSDIEKTHAIIEAILVGKNQDGQERALLADVAKKVEAIDARKAEVQNRNVVFALLSHAGCFAGFGREINRVIVGLKAAFEKRAERWIAFRDQKAHENSSEGENREAKKERGNECKKRLKECQRDFLI